MSTFSAERGFTERKKKEKKKKGSVAIMSAQLVGCNGIGTLLRALNWFAVLVALGSQWSENLCKCAEAMCITKPRRCGEIIWVTPQRTGYIHFTEHTLRDRSQTLGVAWCKYSLLQIYFGPPLRPQKNSWKLRVNPIEKHVNSIFTGRSVIFSRPPLQGSKILTAPFLNQPPLQVFVNGS